ncbi:FkbM family methyltransferase [Glacieibacterium frigidum]|uniref:FkbM family methyltransferase n=1 Tax=Glacieibacterium frigidum TaxID=2593303 RepID=A0A552UG73_9SPHN|nr:FkbM family methyltransferase [Glacieibacterium frigidum]TRW17197.1 FkbM family methyltransferase [Glacieibacterium frigidum]
MSTADLWRRIAARLQPGAASFEAVEQAERAFYHQTVRPGMTVFDVGAHLGELSRLFASLAVGGTVHAFEANPGVAAELRENIRGIANLVVNAVAVSDHAGSVQLHSYDGPFRAFNSLADRPFADYGIDPGPVRRDTVPATTIDDYCAANAIRSIDLLKIDVEGAELQVLRGARAMLAESRIACVIFEFGQATFDMGNTPAALAAFLTDCGYKLENLIANEPLWPGGSDVRTARFAMHIARP